MNIVYVTICMAYKITYKPQVGKLYRHIWVEYM